MEPSVKVFIQRWTALDLLLRLAFPLVVNQRLRANTHTLPRFPVEILPFLAVMLALPFLFVVL